MKKLVTILLVLVLAGFAHAAAVSYPVGTVVLNDDFDGGTYGENVNLVGQTSSNGSAWTAYTWRGSVQASAVTGTSWGETAIGAGYTAGDTNTHSGSLQLASGNFLGDDMQLKFDVDIRSDSLGGGVEVSLGMNGGVQRMVIAHLITTDWGGGNAASKMQVGAMHYIPLPNYDPYGYQQNSGWKITSSGYDNTLWWHVEAIIDNAYYGDTPPGPDSRDAGDEQVTINYWQIPDASKPTPAAGYASGTVTYSNVDLGGTWMRPINLQLAFDDYGVEGVGGWGSDNLVLQVIPEPATMAVLAIGGILALLRRRR